MQKPNTIDDFFKKTTKTPTCWIWTGSMNAYGYGVFSLNKKMNMAHRFSWELVNGKIPKDLQIDHICKARNCVNPSHMELVTLIENVMRGESLAAKNARKTKCQNGHEFDFTKNFDGSRGCRICERIRARERYKKRKLEKAIQKAEGK